MKYLNDEAIRVWYEVGQHQKEKSKMIYSIVNDNSDTNTFFEEEHCKDKMKRTFFFDLTGRYIYEKDILEKNGKRGIVFYSVHKSKLQILYNDGQTEDLSYFEASKSKIIGNIYENPLSAVN